MRIQLNSEGKAVILGHEVTTDQAEILNCLLYLAEPIPAMGMGRFLSRLAAEADIAQELEKLCQSGLVIRHQMEIRINNQRYMRDSWSVTLEVKQMFNV